MGKLLGLGALLAVLLLSACGSSVETVCTLNTFGEELVFTAKSDDGIITSLTTEVRIDVSGFDNELIEAIEEEEGGVLDGNYVVSSETDTNVSENLENFISGMELIGATCD